MRRSEEQLTAATKHPGWDAIVADIEARFPHFDSVQKLCIDAVSAHLLGVPERAEHDLLCLGEPIAHRLIEICESHGVDLRSIRVKHVHH